MKRYMYFAIRQRVITYDESCTNVERYVSNYDFPENRYFCLSPFTF